MSDESELKEKNNQVLVLEREERRLTDHKNYHRAKVEKAMLADAELVSGIPYNSRPAYLKAELEIRLHDDNEYQEKRGAMYDLRDKVDRLATEIENLEDAIIRNDLDKHGDEPL